MAYSFTQPVAVRRISELVYPGKIYRVLAKSNNNEEQEVGQDDDDLRLGSVCLSLRERGISIEFINIYLSCIIMPDPDSYTYYVNSPTHYSQHAKRGESDDT